MSVKAPTEKNFRRAKVKPATRRPPRRRLSWHAVRLTLVVLTVVYAGYRATALVLHAQSLQVSRIVVRGNVRLSAGEVQALVDGLRGTNILTANLSRYRRRLLESPWVADVALRRQLPSTIDVLVSERRPMGLCRLGSQVYLVDRYGMLIDEFGPQYAEFDLPIIDGLVRAPGGRGSSIDPVRAALAARLMDAISVRRSLAAQVSQIDVSDVHDAVVLLDRDSALLHVGETRFLERLQSYVDLAPTLRDRVPAIDYVDLRFDERVYVRPSGGGRVPVGTAGTSPAERQF